MPEIKTCNEKTNKDIEIAERLAAAVFDAGGIAYYVGGCVRDRLMSLPINDIDIEVHGIEYEKLCEILGTLGHMRTQGAAFGIMSLDGYGIDVALPRTEEATGLGHRDFKTIVDPYIGVEKAAKRRDFTVNSVMENILTHEYVDNFGGIDDIKRGILRHVDDKSFVEDPLRVFRAAGFVARFGFYADRRTLELCKQMNTSELSGERVASELEKALIKSSRPSVFFRFLRECDKLENWFSELAALVNVKQDPRFHAEGDAFTHTMLVIDESAKLKDLTDMPFDFMLASLCHDYGKSLSTTCENGRIRSIGHELTGVDLAHAFSKRLALSNKTEKYIKNMVLLHMRPNQLAFQGSGQKAYNRLFDESLAPADLLLLAKADHLASHGENMSAYDEAETGLKNALSEYERLMSLPQITGADLIACGITPGKNIGKALEYAHKLMLAGIPKSDALPQVLSMAKKLDDQTLK